MNSQTLPPSSFNAADEAAVRALYQELLDSWDRGDGNAYAAPFTEELRQLL